ncbi:MAG TPA: hypothetical protein VFV82_04970 [Candidatus Binatia bacterium]|nr:hypothetical protein [Candidatus Binatia bacterium]
MTILNKKLRRETTIPADHHGRNIIIELDPGPPCVVRFREKGRRTAIDAPIGWLYYQALKAEAERRARKKAQEKARKKKAKRGLLAL